MEEKLSDLISHLKRNVVYRFQRSRGASTRTWYIFQKPMDILMVSRKFCLCTVPVIHSILRTALLVHWRFIASHWFCHGSEMGWQRPP